MIFKFFKYILFITCFAIIIQTVNITDLNVSPDDTTINVYTNYYITIDRTLDNTGDLITPLNLVPAGSLIIITFPAQYNTSVIYTCDAPYDSCYMNGNNLTIPNQFPNDTNVTIITIIIRNVLNPSPAFLTSGFMGYIGIDQTVINPSSIVNYVQLTPANFQSCNITFNPNFMNSTSNMTVNLIPQNMIPLNGYIIVQMPANGYWSLDLKKQPFWNSSLLTCSNLTSNILSSLNCSGNLTSYTINISSFASSNFTSQFYVQLNNIISPPTLQPLQVDYITVSSYYPHTNYMIDTYSGNVNSLLPKTFTLTITNQTSFIVNRNTSLKFSIVLADFINTFHTFAFTFPSGSILYANSIGGPYTTGNMLVRNAVLTWNQSIPSQKTVASGFALNFSYYYYQAPVSTQGITITAGILLNGYYCQTGSTIIYANPNILSFNIIPLIYTINANTTYTFTITTYDTISSSGMIKIDFPMSITLSIANSSYCATVSSDTYLTSNPLCILNANSLYLTAINSSSANIPARTIIINISGIINPASTQPTSTFTISTFYSNSNNTLVATTSSGSITATPALINVLSTNIQSSSYKVLDSAVTYNFTFNNTNVIPANGFIQIGIPTTITVSSTISSCTLRSTSVLCSMSTKNNFQYITMTQTTSLVANSNIIITINSLITNPSSTSPINNIILSTYDSNNYTIDQLTSGLSLQMTIPSQFSFVAITPLSSVNNAITSYKFQLIQPNILTIGAFLNIYFPSQIKLQSGFNCFDLSGNILTCNMNSSYLQITMISTINGNTLFGVNITNIKNSQSLKPSSTFGFQTKTSDGLYYYSQNSSTVSITNLYPSTFSSLTYTFSNQYLNASEILTLSFIPTNNISGHATLILASSFIVNSLSCQSNTFSGNCNNTNGNSIQINGFTSINNMTIEFTGFSSPLSAPSDYTKFSSYDNNGFLIDQSTSNIIFTLSCTLPCKTCSSNPTSCSSCYNSTTITNNIYFDASNSNCISTCLTGYYADTTTLLCTVCSTICLNCSLISTNCTSCNTSSSNKYLNYSSSAGTCLVTCPQYYYPDQTQIPVVCRICTSPCSTCTSQTACSTCTTGYFYYLTNCLGSCPVNVSIADNVQNICNPCSSVCATCTSTISNCTSCSSNAAVYNSNCVSSCPNQYVNVNGNCVSCISPCFTCINTTSTCTFCLSNISNNLLYQNTCVIACPTYYFNSTANGICTACSTLSLNCNNCLNSSACVTCNSGYVLIPSTLLCQSSVPSGYVNISGIALACTGDCLTCSGTQGTCTSCNTNNLYGTSCVANCPSNYLAINKICLICNSPCSTCSNLLSNCTSCITTLIPSVYLSGNNCINNCPSTTYGDNTTYTCISCTSSCYTCTSATSCSSCSGSLFLYQNNCLSSCPNYFVGISNACQSCVSPCSTCSVTQLNCTSCLATSGLYLTSNQCVSASSCPTNQYANSSTFTCQSCISPCLTCNISASNCTSCISGQYLFINQCLTSCPYGYFNFNTICNICTSPCATCTTSSTSCLSCLTNLTTTLFLNGNQCVTVSSCSIGTYANTTNNICTSCPISCAVCTSSINCSSCNIGYNFQNNLCSNNCSDNKIPVDGICTSCSSICSTCINFINYCTSCNPSNSPKLYLSGYQCLSSCPATYYADDLTFNCSACVNPCLICVSSISCVSCVANYYLLNTSCLSNCPSGYLASNNNCIICTFPCVTCSLSLTNCTGCFINSSIVYYLSEYSCVTKCPELYYPSNQNCILCLSPCLTCTSAVICLTCISTFLQYNSTCISTCPTGYINVTNICTICSTGCTLCTNFISNCTSCATNYFFYLNSCVVNCSGGLYGDTMTLSCLPCSSPCSACSIISTNCTSCSIGYLYVNNCLNQCPSTYYQNNNICSSCPQQCSACKSINNCSSCITGYYFYMNFCVSSCPSDYAVIKYMVCTKCSTSNCISCTSLDLCIKCTNPLLIHLAQCISSCPANYISNGTQCINDTANSLVTTLSNSKFFPLPCSIASVVVIIICCVSRLQNRFTFIAGGIYSLLGLLEWGVMIIFGFLYFQEIGYMLDNSVYAILAGFAILYIINIINLIIVLKVIRIDEKFDKWIQKQLSTKLSYRISFAISLIISHKIFNILFSRLFNFNGFKAQLQSIKKFFWLNIISFLTLIHTILCLGVATYIGYNHSDNKNQVYLQSIDVILVFVLNFIFSLANSHKTDNFFNDTSQLEKKQNLLKRISIDRSEDLSVDEKNEQLTINKLIDEDKQNQFTIGDEAKKQKVDMNEYKNQNGNNKKQEINNIFDRDNNNGKNKNQELVNSQVNSSNLILDKKNNIIQKNNSQSIQKNQKNNHSPSSQINEQQKKNQTKFSLLKNQQDDQIIIMDQSLSNSQYEKNDYIIPKTQKNGINNKNYKNDLNDIIFVEDSQSNVKKLNGEDSKNFNNKSKLKQNSFQNVKINSFHNQQNQNQKDLIFHEDSQQKLNKQKNQTDNSNYIKLIEQQRFGQASKISKLQKPEIKKNNTLSNISLQSNIRMLKPHQIDQNNGGFIFRPDDQVNNQQNHIDNRSETVDQMKEILNTMNNANPSINKQKNIDIIYNSPQNPSQKIAHEHFESNTNKYKIIYEQKDGEQQKNEQEKHNYRTLNNFDIIPDIEQSDVSQDELYKRPEYYKQNYLKNPNDRYAQQKLQTNQRNEKKFKKSPINKSQNLIKISKLNNKNNLNDDQIQINDQLNHLKSEVNKTHNRNNKNKILQKSQQLKKKNTDTKLDVVYTKPEENNDGDFIQGTSPSQFNIYNQRYDDQVQQQDQPTFTNFPNKKLVTKVIDIPSKPKILLLQTIEQTEKEDIKFKQNNLTEIDLGQMIPSAQKYTGKKKVGEVIQGQTIQQQGYQLGENNRRKGKSPKRNKNLQKIYLQRLDVPKKK